MLILLKGKSTVYLQMIIEKIHLSKKAVLKINSKVIIVRTYGKATYKKFVVKKFIAKRLIVMAV